MLTMAESATQTITIEASPEHCFAVAIDFPRYPEWAKDVKDATVRRDRCRGPPDGRVEFRASALGRSTHYTLAYDYSRRAEEAVVAAGARRHHSAIDGAYTFAPSAAEPARRTSSTTCRSSSSCPLPGFVKRRAEVRILNTVKELKARAEA